MKNYEPASYNVLSKKGIDAFHYIIQLTKIIREDEAEQKRIKELKDGTDKKQ